MSWMKSFALFADSHAQYDAVFALVVRGLPLLGHTAALGNVRTGPRPRPVELPTTCCGLIWYLGMAWSLELVVPSVRSSC